MLAPTGLSLSPDGSFIASNSMDNTVFQILYFFILVENLSILTFKVRIWDIRPFATNDRCVNILQGIKKFRFFFHFLGCCFD